MVKGASKGERQNRLREFRGWRILTGPRRHQQVESAQHFGERTRRAIVPGNDALGGVSPAQERQAHVRAVIQTAFVRNLREQASPAGGNRIPGLPGKRQAQHVETLAEAGARIVFMREHPWENEDDFIDRGKRCFSQREVGYGDRIECARQDSQALRLGFGPAEELHRFNFRSHGLIA
jgi:hypothetical protein